MHEDLTVLLGTIEGLRPTGAKLHRFSWGRLIASSFGVFCYEVLPQISLSNGEKSRMYCNTGVFLI